MSKDDYIIPEKNVVPKDWVSLSDDEITKILHHPDGNLTIRGFARAIEQALKEKNHV